MAGHPALVAARQGGGPSWSAETPASTSLGGGLLGWLPQTSLATTQFSVRGLGPEPAEPAAGSTRDVEGGADEDQAYEDDEHFEDEAGEGLAGSFSASTEEPRKAGPFAPRRRSAEIQQLPLTVEQSMFELKRDLWGAPGTHRNARRARRKEWKVIAGCC